MPSKIPLTASAIGSLKISPSTRTVLKAVIDPYLDIPALS
jgi:hypothetical protein